MTDFLLLADAGVVGNLWGISPATVFGALAAVLAAGNVMQWRKITDKDAEIARLTANGTLAQKEHSSELLSILRENLTTLEGLKSAIDGLGKSITDTHTGTLSGQDRVVTEVKTVGSRIEQQIGRITEKIG